MAILAFFRLANLFRLDTSVDVSDVEVLRVFHIQVLQNISPLQASERWLHLGLVS